MLKKLLTIALLAGSMVASYATSISGNITFGGSVTLDTGDAGTATAVTSWSGIGGVGSPYVVGRDGAFTGYVSPADAVTFATPWSFNSGAANFWSVGGFTFNLTSSAITTQTASSVSVDGVGYLSGNGFDTTFGTWHFTTQNPGAGSPAQFSFSAATGVPDGGSTLALMGGAVLALGVFRRKLTALVS